MADRRLRLIVEAVTSAAQQKLRSFQNSIKQFGDQASLSLEKPVAASENLAQSMGIMAKAGTLFLADLALRYGQMAAESVMAAEKTAASNLAIASSFEDVAIESGLSSQRIVESLKYASKNTAEEYATIAAASRAMRMGVADDIDEFEKLMKIAYVRGRETGAGTTKAWQQMVEGISSGYPYLLRNLNILIDTDELLDKEARRLGVERDELTKNQEVRALTNEVIRQGATDLEKWNEVGEDGIDVFAQYEVTMASFRQELAEKTLPAVIDVTKALITLPTILDQLGYITGVYVTGTKASLQDLLDSIKAGDWGAVLSNQAKQVGEDAMRSYAILDDWNKNLGPEMEELTAKVQHIRDAVLGVGDAGTQSAEDLEEIQDGLKKAADIWADYLSDVEQKNWQFGRRVSDAQWSATQAAEDAAFRLYEIERDAAQRVDDLYASFYLKDRYDLIEHQRDMKRLRQDHLDEMRDLEWEYQQDVRQTLEAAPWWVRQALSKEFAERERIRKSGDEKALKQYDKQLLRRIKAVDPVYAKELKLLQEQYDHETDIKEREARKDESRREEDWRLQEQEQADALSLQLSQLERELADQRQAWQFSNAQRLESEKHAMDNLVIEHGHAMDLLAEQVQKKLADITPIWEHYGHEWAMALIQGMATGQMYTPVPAGYTPPWNNPWAGLQEGMPYVPRTMPAVLHRGEAVLTKEEAAAWRAGDNINITVNLSGGYTPYQAQRLGEAVRSELGADIRRRSR